MSPSSIVILVVIGILLFLAVFGTIIRKKNKKGCCSNCKNCKENCIMSEKPKQNKSDNKYDKDST